MANLKTKNKCEVCGKYLKIKKYCIRFCSRRCQSLFQWKNKRTQVIKNFICKYCSKEFKRKVSPSGFPPKYCSRKCVGLSSRRDKNKKYPEEFYLNRKKALKRDNHTCRLCGFKEPKVIHPNYALFHGFNGVIHVHHIDYDRKNSELCNLITLCFSCHPKTNSHRQEWTKYFKFLLKCT